MIVMGSNHKIETIFETKNAMTRLDEITLVARSRMQSCSDGFVSLMGGSEMDFMTPQELAERHAILQSMPSSYEEQMAAKARIAKRIAARKRSK